MQTERSAIAVIGLGSNSVRMKVFSDGIVLCRQRRVTRLGGTLAVDNRLSEKSMADTLSALDGFINAAKGYGATVCVFATEATRRADNGGELVKKIKDRFGLTVDVLSGEREAQIGYLGAMDGDGAIIDVGGGSTEIRAVCGGKESFSVSLPVGAVVLYTICGQSVKKMNSVLDDVLSPVEYNADCKIKLLGGTAACIGSMITGKTYCCENYDGAEVSLASLNSIVRQLIETDVASRVQIAGMDATKADVILCGAVIYKRLFEALKIKSATVSESDNLDGYAKAIFNK